MIVLYFSPTDSGSIYALKVILQRRAQEPQMGDDSGEWDGQELLHLNYVLTQIPLFSQVGKSKYAS